MHTDQNILTEKLFEELFNTLYERLCRSSYRIVQNEFTAEDIVQETFCTLWRKKEELKVDSFEAYLLRSVYNASLNSLKKSSGLEIKSLDEETSFIKESSINPEQKLQYLETKERINQAIDNLPAACRAIFVLSRFENRSNKEIASELSLSIKTVENQMTKALRILRQAVLINLILLQHIY